MKSERKTISSRQLDLLANNPRTITKESLDRLCESIRRNGFWEHMPVAVEPVEGTDRFRVLHGNQRVKAMRLLKRYEIPCVIYYELTPPERDEIILRGNINNGEWDYNILQTDYELVDFEDIGLVIPQVEMPDAESDDTTDDNTDDNEGSDDDTEAQEHDDVAPERLSFWYKMLGDYLYPSNNEYQIPTLMLDAQPVHLELPFAPWGAEGRYKKGITTYHFYVDDYRFEALFKDPVKLLMSGCRAIVEPNCSIHDQTPVAYALFQIYKKRYLARYLQECGVQVWADLNVSPHYEEYNRLGIPDGYNAFFTRGVSGWLETTERHYEMARRISGMDRPNIIVYGGGSDVRSWCEKHDVVHVHEYINKGQGK